MWAFLFKLLIQLVVSFVVAKLSKSGDQGGDPGTIEDLSLPTVSQNRKIPVVVGKARVASPNILDAGGYRTIPIKTDDVTIAHKRYLDVMTAIAWGPGELHQIWIGDYKLWDKDDDNSGVPLTTETRFLVDKPKLFGSEKQDGGVKGYVHFYPGTATQDPNPYFEGERIKSGRGWFSTFLDTGSSEPGKSTPGYRHLAYLVFEDFYFGTSKTFRPLSFEYAHYPNPYNQTDHKIGEDANPAYVQYAIWKDLRWGADIAAIPDADNIKAVAAQLHSEGLGMSRTWLQGQGDELEEEVSNFAESVRYASPTTGLIQLDLARFDYDVATLDSLDSTDLVEPPDLVQTNLSGVATNLYLSFTDRVLNRPAKIHLPNLANRAMLGRRVAVDLDFPGCSNGVTGQKIIDREGYKQFQSLWSGTLVASRKAWHWPPGKVFKYSDVDLGITDLVFRLGTINRGSLKNGSVAMSVIQDRYAVGIGVFETPVSGALPPYTADPIDIGAFRFFELPAVLIASNVEHTISVLASRPTGDSYSFIPRLNLGSGYTDLGSTDFAPLYKIAVAATELETSIVLAGSFAAEDAAWDSIKTTGLNMAMITTSAGEELIAFETVTYDDVADQTTLNNVHRGLIDTYPKPAAVDDFIWILEPAVLAASLSGTQALTLKMLTQTSRGTLSEASATPRPYTLQQRHSRPLLPGDIELNGSNFPAAVVGPLTVSWNHRDETHPELVQWADGSNYGPAAGTTYKVDIYNDDTSTLLQSNSGLSGTSDTWTDTGQSYNIRVEITAQNGGLDSNETFVFVTAFSEP